MYIKKYRLTNTTRVVFHAYNYNTIRRIVPYLLQDRCRDICDIYSKLEIKLRLVQEALNNHSHDIKTDLSIFPRTCVEVYDKSKIPLVTISYLS